MNLESLKCVNENVNLHDYLKLYKYVLDNMEHPEWLGTFEESEIIEILANDGKIWLYYHPVSNDLVCSVFYIPPSNKALRKHNIETDETETGSLGPIMVSPDYVGNGLQLQMMKVFNDYVKSINKKYIFTKVHRDNIYSLSNIEKDGYILTHEYENERGPMAAYLKTLS